MKCRSITLAVFVLSLSACNHLSHKNNVPVLDDSSEVVAPAQTGNTTADDQASTANNETSTAQPQPKQPEQTNVIVHKLDLLQRMQAGFRLPNIESRNVSQYQKWSSQHPTYLKNLFARAEPFLFFILNEIEKRNMPTEIALLPAIESAYKPNAVSSSKASGLWQFIPSTGKYYGLKQNWWYDGRRDVVASTTAALDYLEELNKLFDGDWFLTLAAYNAGQGTVLKAIKYNKRKHLGTRYQDLKLRTETRRYVPKLIALRNIIANPHQFNVKLPSLTNQAHFEVYTLDKQINLASFAKQANIDDAELQHLNADYLRWATPPTGQYRLLVPIKNNADVTQILSSLESFPDTQYREHKIARGESLSVIAQRYGVSLSALKSANKLSSNNIRQGRNLVIPVDLGKAPAYASQKSSSKQNRVMHKVVAGDTLWSISKRYRVKIADILSWNKLYQNQILSLNQRLTIFPK